MDSTGSFPPTKQNVHFYNVLPGDFKENEDVKTPDGTYTNRALCKSDQMATWGYYRFKIWLSGSLTSGSDTIPIENLKYLFTYTNGSGEKYNFGGAYKPILASYTDLYSAETTADNTKEIEIQLKYAIQVPSDQLPGTYTGATINYDMYDPESGSAIGSPDSVDVYIHVLPMFQLYIDRGTIDFEDMLPGHEKENVPVEGIIVTTKSNTGNPWFLKISNNSPLTSGPNIIPNEYFKWYGWTDGTGRWYGTGEDAVSLTPKLVYSSGAGETHNIPDGTKNHFKFKLKVPPKQKPGKYISRVRLTLTE